MKRTVFRAVDYFVADLDLRKAPVASYEFHLFSLQRNAEGPQVLGDDLRAFDICASHQTSERSSLQDVGDSTRPGWGAERERTVLVRRNVPRQLDLWPFENDHVLNVHHLNGFAHTGVGERKRL